MIVQHQFLCKLLQEQNKTLLTINNINKDYFSDYQEEFSFIKDHLDKYGKIPDIQTFIAKFPKFENIEVNEPDNYLLDELYEDRKQRVMASTFNKVRDLVLSGKVNEAEKTYKEGLESLSSAIHLDSVDIIRDTSRYDRYVEKTKDFNKYYITTGFEELDKIIGGWDRLEENATIVARPGVGKSWLALFTAVAGARQGLNVGIYSGEMSVDKVGYRADTLISHISNGSIIHGNVEVANEYKSFLDDLPNQISGSIRVLEPRAIGGPAGVSALRAFIEKDKLDMLVIDQHSLLEDDRKAKNPVEKASNISRDIKNLQVMCKIPIISVSQQNRASVEDGFTTANVAQSDRISQDSTIVIFLEKKDNVLTLHLVKSRDGGDGNKLKYLVDLNKGKFEYVEEDIDEESANELEKSYEPIEKQEPF